MTPSPYVRAERIAHARSTPRRGLSIGATDNREQIKNLLSHCGRVAPPLDATALRRIEQRLKRRYDERVS